MKRRIIFSLSAVAFLLATQGCLQIPGAALQSVEFSEEPTIPENRTEIQVFAQEVYPILRRDCIACHGGNISPLFAVGNLQSAFETTGLLVNFNDLPASRLIVRSENMHCGVAQSCGPGAGRAESLLQGLQQWARLKPPGAVVNHFTDYLDCKPTEKPPVESTKRLTKLQYSITVQRAFNQGGLLGFTNRSGVLRERGFEGALVSALAQVPEDGLPGEMSRFDLRLSDTHLEGYLAVAQGAVDYYSTRPNDLAQVVSNNCILNVTPDENCVRAFTRTLLGRRILYRPLDVSEEQSFYQTYLNSVGTPYERFLMLVRTFLLHPEFVLNLKYRGMLVPGELDRQQLSAFEFAKQLSYHFTDGPPSVALYNDAASGALLNNQAVLDQHLAGFAAGNAGSFKFPLSDHHWTYYSFLEQWLRFNELRGFPDGALSGARFPGFSFHAGNENWANESRDELYAYGFKHMFQSSGNYSQFMTDTRGNVGSFISRIYGVAEGSDVELGSTRPGFLSRVGYLSSGEIYPNPIIFGVHVMRDALCQEIPALNPATLPPGFRDGGPRSAHPTFSTREYVQQQTSAPACMSCHERINPFGFASVKYDGAGFFDMLAGRENIYDFVNNQLTVVGNPTLNDTTTVPIDDQLHQVTGIAGLASVIAGSQEGPLCMARKIVSYSKRREAVAQDACSIARVYQGLRNQNLNEAWKEVGRDPLFRVRAFTPK